ncbi:MAG TPA: WcbI family polysaccharide biosynthesis putative acetyltransferase [Methylocella sp.]|nr:WcbI family polysaccharide biosynthesis putative acetyltransferase [Methylocella sp.]
MKIAILFNCQHLGLGNAMRALRPDLIVQSYELHSFHSAEGQQKLLAQLEGFDVIIAPGLGADWGSVSTESLRSKSFKFHTLLGIGFAGYHPDTVYVETPAGHLQAATGPYHSRIAIAAFLAGLSVEETADLFNKLVYSRLGYLDAFQQARLFLINQFKTIGIDLTRYIDAWAAEGCFMHSLNHPKMRVLCDLAVMACELAGIEVPDDRTHLEMLPDHLSQHVQMPVYPEIASHLGIKGHRMFKTTQDCRNYQFFPLNTYIASCFKFYEAGSRNHLLKANGVLDAMEKLGLDCKVSECTA